MNSLARSSRILLNFDKEPVEVERSEEAEGEVERTEVAEGEEESLAIAMASDFATVRRSEGRKRSEPNERKEMSSIRGRSTRQEEEVTVGEKGERKKGLVEAEEKRKNI